MDKTFLNKKAEENPQAGASVLNNLLAAEQWNNMIDNQINQVYNLRTNIKFLIGNNGSIEEILDPEIKQLIEKLTDLKR